MDTYPELLDVEGLLRAEWYISVRIYTRNVLFSNDKIGSSYIFVHPI